jgi:hypothetical protein
MKMRGKGTAKGGREEEHVLPKGREREPLREEGRRGCTGCRWGGKGNRQGREEEGVKGKGKGTAKGGRKKGERVVIVVGFFYLYSGC